MLLVWLVVLLMVLVLYLREVYSRFSRYGIKTAKPLPIFGNSLDGMLQKRYIGEELSDLYTNFPEERFVGRYEFMNSLVIVRDLELVKKITVKDFEYFLDHRSFIDGNIEPIFGRNLLSLKGQEWRDMRSTLSPAFTSSKMRIMVPFMVEVNNHMVNSLKRQIGATGVDYVDLDCKDLTTRYTNDVIACCAFGLKMDSHTDVDNQFYTIGKDIATFGLRQKLIFTLYFAFPTIMKKLKIKLLSEAAAGFFKGLLLTTIKEREDKHILRPDMIHLLMEAKKGKLEKVEKYHEDGTAGFSTVEEFDVSKKTADKEWSDDDLVAQAMIFFIAGFENVSSAMSFLLYELAINPDIQDRLVQEIREQHAKNGGKFDFNSVQSMKYMDMVVSELLRRWPPAFGLDRLCTKDYNMGKPNNNAKDFILRKGEAVVIPTWGFHLNPEYFPDPYKFDPERFSDENKHKIKPFTYMPFGLGPRNCIGSRFTLCEIKVMAYQLLLHMEVMPCEKTPVQAKLAIDTFNLKLDDGHWLRFKIRK